MTGPVAGKRGPTGRARGATAVDLRERNISAILRVLRETGPVSRSGLASRLGLSRSGMTPIVAEMVDRGLVRESGGQAVTRGRPPIMLTLTADDLCIIGIELRRDRIGYIVEAIDGSYLDGSHDLRTSIPHDPDQAAELVASLVLEAQQRTGRTAVGVGVCLPGEKTAGRFVDSPVLGWHEVPIASLVAEALGKTDTEIVIVDIAAAATLGAPESMGAALPVRAHIQFGPGLGMGLTDLRLDGGLRPESKGIGHVGWPGATARCWCGRTGCLDTILGMHHVAQELCERTGIAPPGEAAQLVTLVAEALDEDAAAVDAWTETLAARVAWTVRLVAQLEHPDVITLGGYVCQLDDRFEAALRSHLTPDNGIPSSMSVLRSTNDDASMLGVAAIAGHSFLSSPLTVLDAVRGGTRGHDAHRRAGESREVVR